MNRAYSSQSSTAPGQSGRWFRRGNTVVLKLGATASTNELESELDFESPGGGIPVHDYLRWVQFSLNLYFVKKGRPERSPEDGKDSARYRAAVKLFKSLAGIKPADDKVDEKTQNALILANESNPAYLAWLRKAFDKLGYAHLTIAYKKHEKPVAVILEFQRDYTGRIGFTLKDDAFMGAKTHLALLRAVKALTPKPKPAKPTIPPKPKEVTDEQLDYKLLLAEEWIREYENTESHTTELCILRKLKLQTTDDTYFEAPKIHEFFGPDFDKTIYDFSDSARGFLKKYIRRQWRFKIPVKPTDIVERLKELVTAVTAGIQATDISYCHDPRRRGVQRELKRLSTRRDSLYSCPGIKEVVDGLKGCVG